MEDIEIINLWKSYSHKLDESLMLNQKNAEDITHMKIRSLLASMRPLKIFTILAGIVWVAFIDILIINIYPFASWFFLVSAGILSLLNTMAIGVYLYQLILIHEVDISEPILTTQERLNRLRTSTLWVARILFLQFPLWTTFYLNEQLINNIPQMIVTSLFTLLAIWLFFNIKYENRDKKWFKLIFRGKEWTPLIKSMDLLSQIDEYKII